VRKAVLIVVMATLWLMVAPYVAAASPAGEVRLKDLGRFLGWRDNMLVGYGIVTGLAGSGDTPRNQATRQAMSNLLSQFDLNVPLEQIQSRNVAMVMVTATLPPVANVGDKIDVNVTSTGDARSLAGGTLIMAELKGPDRRVYALAQGPVTVGGYRYDANGNLRQKNHPTVGVIPEGATVESSVQSELARSDGALRFVLKQADATTAERIAREIDRMSGSHVADAVNAQTIRIVLPAGYSMLNSYVAKMENLAVLPDQVSRVVVNERTGVVAAGGDTRISPITISHSNIRVAVDTQFTASQPETIGRAGSSIRSIVVGNSDMSVEESAVPTAQSFSHSTVQDVVQALSKANVSTRDQIAILQAIKAAGAMHAELVVQ